MLPATAQMADQETILGAIDAGSNALRVVIARVGERGALVPVERLRLPVRLGRGAFTRGELESSTVDDAVAAFARFRALFDQHGVSRYRAVATSALRNSRNREIVQHRVYHETGIELEVISGEEEARLVRKAVKHAFHRRPTPMTIIDLGGGSLEVNVRTGSRWRGASLPIGTVRLVELFGLTGAIDPDEQAMVRRYVDTLLRTFIRADFSRDFSPVVVCGGNAEAFARLIGQPQDDMPSFRTADLSSELERLLPANVQQRMRTYNVRRDRADVMGVAGLVLQAVAETLGIQQVLVPGVGIRDALLIDIQETLHGEQPSGREAREKALLLSARMFASRVGHDLTHSRQVQRLARTLFDELRDLHRLPGKLGIVLDVAALLHDVGEVIETQGHQKHGEYMVREGRLPGLEGDYRNMVAALVRLHRDTEISARKHESYGLLSDERRSETRRLLALLRVADSLDAAHRQMVTDIDLDRRPNKVIIRVSVNEHPDAPIALTKADLFEAEFGVPVVARYAA